MIAAEVEADEIDAPTAELNSEIERLEATISAAPDEAMARDSNLTLFLFALAVRHVNEAYFQHSRRVRARGQFQSREIHLICVLAPP